MIADQESQLAAFVDRNTMVYERWYRHDIDLVFEAVSTAEHLDIWMLPESRVERRLGGECRFGWGGSADESGASVGTVTVFDPPNVVEYTLQDGESFMRFDLSGERDGTRLLFTLHFLPTPGASEDEPWVGGDLPAGPDTAWRPGFVAGYHEFLDDLGAYLVGQWSKEDRIAHLADAPVHHLRHDQWVERYRAHIRETCPPAR